MRNLIISLFLVSTAAMPALAQDGDGDRGDRGAQSSQSNDGERAARRAARAERVEARRAERSERFESDRPANSEAQVERVRVQRDDDAAPAATDAPRRPRFVGSADSAAPQTQERRDRRSEGSLARRLFEMRNAPRDGTVETRHDRDGTVETRHDRDGTVETRHDRDGGRDRRGGGHGEYHRDVNREHGELHTSDPSRREHRNWHRDVTRQHDRRHSAWNTSWRNDRSYDWRHYRDRNRSIFRFGNYYDPYRYGYRRFSIGFNLWPSYYSSNFWLNDPWQYRLPPAYGPYRWVRYYDDALLVNVYTGEVADVIYSFFW